MRRSDLLARKIDMDRLQRMRAGDAAADATAGSKRGGKQLATSGKVRFEES